MRERTPANEAFHSEAWVQAPAYHLLAGQPGASCALAVLSVGRGAHLTPEGHRAARAAPRMSTAAASGGQETSFYSAARRDGVGRHLIPKPERGRWTG